MQTFFCKKNTDVILFSFIDVAFQFGSVSLPLSFCVREIYSRLLKSVNAFCSLCFSLFPNYQLSSCANFKPLRLVFWLLKWREYLT